MKAILQASIKSAICLPTRITLLALLLTACGIAQAGDAAPPNDRLAWFRDAKFGMFIHWGIYSVPAGEWKGKTSYAEWFQLQTQMPCKEYDQFAGQFNPVKFDASRWAETAKNAGMKYLVITSKHHDGFCMYDTKFSPFNIVNSTPLHRDPMKELAEACRKVGIKFCFYYSIADWHNPDSPAIYSQRGFHGQPKADADVSKYADYMRNQVHELLTGYGPIGILWFDGGGAFRSRDRAKLLKADEMVKMIHETQPDCLINNRLGAGSDYGTPEQYIPAGGPKEPFEVCMTLNGHWGYNKADQKWKSTVTLLHNLIDIVSKGGNYLLNVGPTAEGLIPAPSVERLKEIGAWLAVNGEAIYGAGPTALGYELGKPGKPDSRGRATTEGALDWRCTTKPAKLYIHLFQWPKDKFALTGVKHQVTKAYLLADRGKLLPVTQDNQRLEVQLPAQAPDPLAAVLCLEIRGGAAIGADKTPQPATAATAATAPASDPRLAIDVAAIDRTRILKAAAAALAQQPLSITAYPARLSQGGPNDFYSNGDYWWPDPRKPDGLPYIQRDGESNPQNFSQHRLALESLRDSVAALAAAYKLTGDDRYAAKAAELLRVFFLDPKTRMNPHLNFAQAIPGVSPGRGIGIIDALHLIEVPPAIRALEKSDSFPPAEAAGLRQWFRELAEWMTTSENGQQEARAKNNHAVAFYLQLAVYADFIGDEKALAECRRQYKDVFVAKQMAGDGSFPAELARTKPYGYSIFQLDNMVTLCQVLSRPGGDLWSFETKDGRGIQKAVAFLYPFLADKSKWTRRHDVQAWDGWPARQPCLLFAGLALDEPGYLELWKRLPPDPSDAEVQRNITVTQPFLWLK